MPETTSLPLPATDGPAAPYWEALARGELRVQACAACGHLRWPPAPRCPECLAAGGSWREVEPAGTVWSYAVYDHCFHPAFASEIPYVVALVELDAGPRLITNIVGIDVDDVTVGMRVEGEFFPASPEVTLLRFRPRTEDER